MGEEEAENQRWGGQTGTPTSGADAPTDLSQSGVIDARNRRKDERWYGVTLHRKGRESWGFVLSSHDMNGGSYKSWGFVLSSHDMNGGSYKRMNGIGNGKSCMEEGGLLFAGA